MCRCGVSQEDLKKTFIKYSANEQYRDDKENVDLNHFDLVQLLMNEFGLPFTRNIQYRHEKCVSS